ncbi:hypothetical protein ACJ5H2_12660 [Nocardioides sp. R1-1]|uniref:hypothetical protein n=1 Tax=Nocardioides sp. R1-1 TaxID=3383502 RepID=UPI0038D171DD
MDIDLAELSAAELLARAEANVAVRRQGEVDQLLLALAWCDRNSADPQNVPGAVPVSRGGDRLVRIGGDGTPEVAELCVAELAIAFEAGHVGTHHLVAAALDLRHRLPLLWQRVLDLAVPAWLARKVASMSRDLDRTAVGLVDAAVAAAVGQSPTRILRLAEAKVIEADLAAHRARVAKDAAATGCWLSRPRPGDLVDPTSATGEAATRRISAKLPAGAAVELDAVIDDLADALAAHQDLADEEQPATRGQLRAEALALLADPHAAAAFLDGLHDPAPEQRPPGPRRKAVVHVHVSALALTGLLPGVARVEQLGPFLLDQLGRLLGRRDITLQPVLDLAAVTSVDAYEHPALVRERAIQRMGGDVFPHSTGGTARLDMDHPEPYVPPPRGGPPGQTGDRNAAPLTRTHHRIKTHGHLPDGGGGYQVRQVALTAYRWVTPHGLGRVVTPHGTTPVEILRAPDGTVIGEVYTRPRYGLELALEHR